MGKVIYGGNKGLVSGPNAGTGQGVYSQHPASTPHYHTGNDTESVKRQARLFISIPDRATALELRKRVPARSRQMFDVLTRIDDPNEKGPGLGFFDFLVSNVSAQRSEKVQISEVLSDTFVAYFFGEKAPVWSIQGTLFNTQQDDWFEAWHLLYNDVLRGSKLASLGVPARLSYNRRTIVGYLLNSSETIMAATETAVSLSFQFLVKRVEIRNDQQYRAHNIALGNTNAAPAPFEAEQGGTGREPVLRTRINARDEAARLINATVEGVRGAATAVANQVEAEFGSGASKALAKGAVNSFNAPLDALNGRLVMPSNETSIRRGANTSELEPRNILTPRFSLGLTDSDLSISNVPDADVGPVANPGE